MICTCFTLQKHRTRIYRKNEFLLINIKGIRISVLRRDNPYKLTDRLDR